MTATNASTEPLPPHQSSPRANHDPSSESHSHRHNSPAAVAPLKSRSESALAWFQRCQQKRARERRIPDVPPETPAAAAWAFFRASVHGGSGIPFVDESLRRSSHNKHYYGPQNQYQYPLPALEIRDDRGSTGKTRTIVSLAARFVVATRPSLFVSSASPSNYTENQESERVATAAPSSRLPRVILLDSTLDVTSLHLANTVSSLLIRQQHDPSHNVAALEDDIASSLRRIHVAHVDDPREWVAVLESIRCQLLQEAATRHHHHPTTAMLPPNGPNEDEQDFPTLLLWDGFLSEPGTTVGIQKEIARQLALLLKDCHVGLMYTTSASFGRHFHPKSLQSNTPSNAGTNSRDDTTTGAAFTTVEPVAQTVLLARDETPEARHEFVATLPGNHQIPYALSAAGVLR